MPTIAESDARVVLERWVSTQNAGDFKAYSALYAERFQGVKRAGQRTQRFERKGWLKDRETMFQKPFKIDVSDVQIRTTCCMATLRFTQRWSSATFQDQGPKELRLVPSKEGLRISGEEMLESNVARENQAATLDPNDMRFVVHAPDTYVVLGVAGPDQDGLGKPVLAKDWGQNGIVSTHKAIALDSLPTAVKTIAAIPVSLYGESGVLCRATLGEKLLLRRVVPHFGTVMTWRGQLTDYNPPPPVPTHAEIAQHAWDEAAGGGLYVATLLDIQGDCSKALWARATERPDPDVFRLETAPEELRARIEATLRTTAAYKAIARAYAMEQGPRLPAGHPPWDYADGKPVVRSWRSKDRHLVSIDASIGSGCGDFTAEMTALFEVRDTDLRMLLDPSDKNVPGDFFAASIVDLNQDGMIEIVSSMWPYTTGEANALLLSTLQGWQQTQIIRVPFHDCGC